MRRRLRFLTVCLLIVAMMALAGTLCFAESASVSVSVTVPRTICVAGATVRSNPNVGVTTQVAGGMVTYIAR